MNDYEFGNLLLQLRTKSGLTQKELADLLQISDKTISNPFEMQDMDFLVAN